MIRKFFNKFKYASSGLKIMSKESSFKIQVSISLFIIGLGLIVSLSLIEWACIILLIGVVLAAELFNTAIEKLCDLFSAGWILSEIKTIKDISAGAVFLLSLIAVIIGLLIFLPKFYMS
jgi:diacylglycerol kinase (ATP)